MKIFPFKILNAVTILWILKCMLLNGPVIEYSVINGIQGIVPTYNVNKTKVFLSRKKCPLAGIQEFLKGTNGKKFKMQLFILCLYKVHIK